MADAVQILWSPFGMNMPDMGTKALVDIHDGDTPNIRMPVRMLSIDTPETTARSSAGAQRVDANFAQLAEWIRERPGDVPISGGLAEFLLPKLATGEAGTLQFNQGTEAADFAIANAERRLTKPGGEKRPLFVRTADQPFDNNNRLLAYVAPNYTKDERETMTLAERSTFNLDMVKAGWAAPFVIYPSIPGEADLPLFLRTAEEAVSEPRGIWGEPATLLAYEYRMMEGLFSNTKKIVTGDDKPSNPRDWRERYCADMRTRVLVGPEDYFEIDPIYRLWIWAADVRKAIGDLNLTPSPRLGR